MFVRASTKVKRIKKSPPPRLAAAAPSLRWCRSVCLFCSCVGCVLPEVSAGSPDPKRSNAVNQSEAQPVESNASANERHSQNADSDAAMQPKTMSADAPAPAGASGTMAMSTPSGCDAKSGSYCGMQRRWRVRSLRRERQVCECSAVTNALRVSWTHSRFGLLWADPAAVIASTGRRAVMKPKAETFPKLRNNARVLLRHGHGRSYTSRR